MDAETHGVVMSLENALALFVLMLVAQLPALITAWVTYIKSKAVEAGLAENTRITKHGSTVAGDNAKQAAVVAEQAANEVKEVANVAAETKTAIDGISKKLNGGIDDAITKAVMPIKTALDVHTAKDAQDIKEVNDKLDRLEKYVHESNHDRNDILQNMVNDVSLILRELTRREPPK